MSDRAALHHAILHNPAEDTHRMGYADLLRESDDPFDRLHGRFLWAGLALSGIKSRPEPEGDGVFVSACNELAETALQVLSVQLAHLMMWVAGQWAWSNTFDTVTASGLPKVGGESTRLRNLPRRGRVRESVVWERGMVHTLRLTRAQWRAGAEGFLRQCPIECVEILDVPGLTLSVIGPELGWWLEARLTVPAVPAHARFYEQSPPHTTPARPAHTWVVDFPRGPIQSRDRFAEHVVSSTDSALAILHARAGDRWPGPAEHVPQDDLLDGLEAVQQT